MRGMEVRRYYRPALSTLPGFGSERCSVSEDLARRMVCLPVYSFATEAEQRDMFAIADLVVEDMLCRQ